MQCSKIKEEWPKFKNWVDKLRSEYQTESVIADWRKETSAGHKDNSKIGKIELCELGEVSKKTQCPSCSKWILGERRMPSPEQKRKINSPFEILSTLYCIVKTDYARGARRGQSQWQYDHCKSKYTRRGVEKKGARFHLSTVAKWRKKYRKSQMAFGWTEDYCRYLDFNSVCWHLINRDMEWAHKIMRIILRLESMMEQHQGRRNIDLISHEQFARLHLSNRERGKDEPVHSQTPTRTTTSNRRQRAIGTSMEKLERQQQLVTVFFFLVNMVATTKNGKSRKNGKNGKDGKE